LNSNIDKQEMQNYLLGSLDADRRIEIEERILREPQVYEELLVVEEELIDQYLAGELSTAERRQFETHFLLTAQRQKNLHFGKLLKRYVDSLRPAETGAPAKKSFSFYPRFLAERPALAFAASLVACLGIIFLVWLAARNPERRAQTVARASMAITLAPGSMRSGGTTQRVNVPPKGVDLKLELQLARPTYPKYRSQLLRESETLQTTDDLKAEPKGNQHIVPLTITREILTPGDYQVRLSGVLDSGQDEFIDNYSFRVIE
jgi:anti-sigma factor RsiW